MKRILRRLALAGAVVAALAVVPQASADVHRWRAEISGAGTVAVAESPYVCGSPSCSFEASFTYPNFPRIELTAYAGPGWTFERWEGSCSGTAPHCSFVLERHDQVVRAVFREELSGPSPTLQVTRLGAGTGTVTSSPTGIECGSSCSTTYAHGERVTLTASPAPGSLFAGWGGSCSGTDVCVVTLAQSATVTAIFDVADTSVAARIVRVTSGSSERGRVLEIELKTSERLRLSLSLVRGGDTLAAREIARLQPGRRLLGMPVPDDVAGGKARLHVVLRDQVGNEVTLTRRVVLGSAL